MKGKLRKRQNKYFLVLEDGRVMNEPLSLKNCQAIERGYDLDDLVEQSKHYTDDMTNIEECFVGHHRDGFRKGFQKALELIGDKKFTEEEAYKIWGAGQEYWKTSGESITFEELIERRYELLQQTEWNVEIEMEPCYYDDSLGGFQTSYKEGMPIEQPKLDKNGCLILKSVQSRK